MIEGDVGAYVATHGDGDLLAIPETTGGFGDIDTRVAFVDGLAEVTSAGVPVAKPNWDIVHG